MASEGVSAVSRMMDLLSRKSMEAVFRMVDEAAETSVGSEGGESSDLDAGLVRLLSGRLDGRDLISWLDLDRLTGVARRMLERLRGMDSYSPHHQVTGQVWELLDLVRRVPVLCRIRDEERVDEWADLILALVEASHFTYGRLFAQRRETYASKTLIRLSGPRGEEALSWDQVSGRVDQLARGLMALTADQPDASVAILSVNRLELALLDMACLGSGIVNVMIPATATDADVAYILEHSRAGTAIVSNGQQLEKVLKARPGLPGLTNLVGLSPDASQARGVLSMDELAARAEDVTREALEERREGVRIDDLASIMYTSGTTGMPKGIMFSQRNVVYKRFARALALPEIGDEDRFLCYLPLFHTFGRFLELAGCVFWGATYCFADNPTIETLTRQMAELKPTVFISIPMKWMQLYEAISHAVDLEGASDGQILRATGAVTGGELKWGLSAAGYLDPDIFRFFQRQGIELMSGFGMTEATGGITMTPPGGYRDHSLGRALPGIELGLAGDGELLVRGPYVMMGYLDLPDGQASFDEAGWLHTGDLMEMSDDGFIRLVDRKKEIYKNIMGQTIAPQKVENLFRDFDSVGRIFLVGDHRKYNTALIRPNPDVRDLDLDGLSTDQLYEHFRSLVVTANSFLAPFERIVDFAIIDRDFDEAQGELTPKGTFRRKAVEENFADQIRELYDRETLSLGGADILVPGWLCQALGITTRELQVDGQRMAFSSVGAWMTVKRLGPEEVQVGSVVYRHGRGVLDLGQLLSTPILWLGNDELMTFAPLRSNQLRRSRRLPAGLFWLRRSGPWCPGAADRERVKGSLQLAEPDLFDLHRAAAMLEAERPEDGIVGVQAIEHVIDKGNGPLVDSALRILHRAAQFCAAPVMRRAFQVVVRRELQPFFPRVLDMFLNAGAPVLDGEAIARLVEEGLPAERLGIFIERAGERCRAEESTGAERDVTRSLLELLAAYGAARPGQYRRLRLAITRAAMLAPQRKVREIAADRRERLDRGFREWLGRPALVAVDPETGREYGWEDVVAFSDEVGEPYRGRLLDAFKETPLLREAHFLFAGGRPVRLEDILPNGVWIRLLGEDRSRSVFRVSVKTRNGEPFDLVIVANHLLTPDLARRETNWLIVCGETGDRPSLTADFGGYWPEQGLWTEAYISGDRLDRALRRLAQRERDAGRLAAIWPFAAWSAMSAFVDLWNRTGGSYPAPDKVVVPMHDYHVGAKLIAVGSRRPFDAMTLLLRSLWEDFVQPLEREYPRLAGLVDPDILFSSVLEVVGEEAGLKLLDHALYAERDVPLGHGLEDALGRFVESVGRDGFLPLQLFFAIKRYRRWDTLNAQATCHARARMLEELYRTYNLDDLLAPHPETRVRFYFDTVLGEAGEPLAGGLRAIIAGLRGGRLAVTDVSDAISDLRARIDADGDTDYFLARLSYPFLRPEDEAEFVAARAGGVEQSEMVVTLADADGQPILVRHALSPKEVGRLHRLFLAASLNVQFRPEHRHLVAVNERGHLVGGLSYEVQPEERTAHLDKIVVAERFGGRGIATAVLEQLFHRLRTAGFHSLTTGFFRPQFFYRFGFVVERRYAGLVKSLVEERSGGNGAAVIHDGASSRPVG